MSDKTKIEWTDEVWNPIAGCSIKSSGCDNCYAMTMAHRLEAMGLPKYQGTTRKSGNRTIWTGKINFDGNALLNPLLWKKPRRIFVNSMSDLFHENVKDEWIDQVFAVMGLCPQHTFQILTKRPERMRDYINSRKKNIYMAGQWIYAPNNETPMFSWPFKNVWLGVSVEDQKTADERIPYLFDTPAALRWISAEPLLGTIDLWEWLPDRELDEVGGIDWVVVGGESGPKSRPMHPNWARSLRDQCKAAGVAYFFKQWGEWISVYDRDNDDPDWRNVPKIKNNNERFINMEGGHGFHGQHVHFIKKAGKKKAMQMMPGEVIQQYPGDV